MKIDKLIPKLSNYKIILASKSPRRKKLLDLIGLEFNVIPADIDENISETNPLYFAKNLAEKKSIEIAKKNPNCIVIGADTIVVVEDKIINKPNDRQDAFGMLNILSGKTHKVYTGISISFFKEKIFSISDTEVTEVTFRKLNEIEINEYIKSGSPMDKAGAYGIQDDFGALFVKNINGCYYNIVGLPIQKLYLKLKEFDKKYL